MPNRLRNLHDRLEQNALWRRCAVATRTWTPSVGFALVICGVIGLSLISAQLQHAVVPSDSYATLTHNHAWVIGVIFVALYVTGIILPIRGALIAVTLFCVIGFVAALPHRNIVGMIFYPALAYTAITTTTKKQKLLEWVQWRRTVYESDAENAEKAASDLAMSNRITAADLVTTNRDIAADLVTSNRSTAADLATSNRDIAADLSRTNQSQRRELARQLRECQHALAEARGQRD